MSQLNPLQQSLLDLHEAFIKELSKRVKEGTATSADMALAWKLLLDNDVPLADLRNKSGANEPADDSFIKNLPFKEVG